MSPWGWTPGAATLAPAPSVVAVRVGTGLQAVVDALPTGGVIQLGAGAFYADNSDPTIPLLVNQFSISLLGLGQLITQIGSPILWSAGYGKCADIGLMPPSGSAYALKIRRAAAAYVQRSRFERLTVGGAGFTPVNPLYLDGAILCDFIESTFAYGTASNVLMDNSDSAGTNVNQFLGCTSNTCGRYGYEILGGTIGGVRIIGGNVEDNAQAAIVAISATGLEIAGVDFEIGTVNLANLVSIQQCTGVRFHDNNIVAFGPLPGPPPTDGEITGSAFVASGSSAVTLSRNQVRGAGIAAGPVLLIGSDCSSCVITPDNLLIGLALDRFIENRGSFV